LLERAVRLSVSDDPPGQGRPDAGQRLQRFLIRPVDIERVDRHRFPAASGSIGRRPA
jgi:hypothetical protein